MDGCSTWPIRRHSTRQSPRQCCFRDCGRDSLPPAAIWCWRSMMKVRLEGGSSNYIRNSSRRNMRYVILRDDDANALTPIDCLERLYRPWLDRGLPVNLAVIPNVRTDVTTPDHKPEGFLLGHNGAAQALPVGRNEKLVAY